MLVAVQINMQVKSHMMMVARSLEFECPKGKF